MCCVNPSVTAPCETGALHDDGVMLTCSASGRLNAPLARWPGPLTDSAASPAVEITSADVDAVYVFATPGVNAPKLAGAPRVSESVAGVVPPTVPFVFVSA